MAAKYGDLAVPSHITLEIAEYRRKITELEVRLRPVTSQPKDAPRHNLPPRDYEQFIGRQPELAELRRLLGPRSRAFVIRVDGYWRDREERAGARISLRVRLSV